ncbi:MAG: glycosyltransferase [Bryobacteraceae bacterium]|nr:glycosyltransferase [Bryobacteraceae bacterium]
MKDAVQRVRSYKVIVVLPAYNEEENMPGLLDNLVETLTDASLDFEVIVVDDGSTDGTPEILAAYRDRMPLHTYRHERNEGLGATIRDGLFHASRCARPKDIIVTMDADETHAPGLILRMVRMVKEGHDVVIASRYQRGARVVGLSLHRRAISSAASLLLRILFPMPGVRDYTCGYRAYRAETLLKAIDMYGDRFVDQEGFQCMVDILLKLRRMPLVVAGEVPLILRYDLKKGASKMRIFETSWRTLKLLVARKFGRV